MKFTGTVLLKPLASGSKSDVPQFFLKTGDKEYVLRMPAENSLDTKNSELNQYKGKQVEVQGTVHNYLIIVQTISAA